MWAAAYGVDRGLLEALVWVESGWQPAATGPDGRLGIGQLSPETVTFVEQSLLGLDMDPLDASDGIRMAARYLRYLLDRTDDDRGALAAWNQGLERTNTDGISASAAAFADEVLAIMSRRASP
jgi:soluble lytic murein transglycosylase-like protein